MIRATSNVSAMLNKQDSWDVMVNQLCLYFPLHLFYGASLAFAWIKIRAKKSHYISPVIFINKNPLMNNGYA